MRTLPVLLLLLAVAVPARAQTPVQPLPIAVPPGAAVQMELDGKDQDLLGMVKSLLTGAATPKTAAGTAAPDAAGANPFLNFLGDGQLTTLLRDIHHLHILSFKPADAASVPAGQPADFLAFYEKPFEAEGGHRLLYLGGSTPVVTVGFDQPRGFAAVVQSSGTVFVIRADGYPDMTIIGNLLRTFGSAIPMPLPGAASVPISAAPPTYKAVPKKASHAKTQQKAP
jgi:hypothetical protein